MATDPVLGSDFFERDDILGLLTKRLNAFKQGYRQNMALLGARSVGKSSILQEFIARNSDPEIISIFMEVPQGSLELFLKRFMGGCLTGLLKSKREDLPHDVTGLIQRAKKYVPKTARHMRSVLRLINLERNDEAYREVLALPRIMREEAGARAIVVLDCFGDLENLPVRDPFGILGKEIMVDKDTLYLVASSHPAKSRGIFREKLNLLFGNFEVFEIKNFDFDSAFRSIQKRIGEGKISRAEQHFLVQMTDARPFYLKTILDRILELLALGNSQIVSKEIIFKAFSDEVLNFSGRIHSHFHCLYAMAPRQKNYLSPIQVLAGIALGHRRIQKLAKHLNRRITDTQKVLQKLLDEEVIQKEGSMYLIPDHLFRFWLRHVVSIGFLGFESDPKRRNQFFLNTLESQYRTYEEELAKDLPKRVEELFRVFSGDTISIGSSKFLCPVFQDVISKPTNGRVFPVYARSGKGSWLCQIASKPVREEDIRVFRDDVRKLRNKVHQRVVVALSGIDLNATLMAKDSKISVWDLKNFNTLLDIYDRPKVIL